MKGWMLCTIAAVCAAAVLGGTALVQHHRFYSKGLQETVSRTEEQMAADSTAAPLSYRVTEHRDFLVSKVFLIDVPMLGEKQIRFRCLYLNPFDNTDLRSRSAFSLKTADGENITSKVGTYSEEFWSCEGLSFFISLKDEAYHAYDGQTLVFTYTLLKDNADDAESLASGRLELDLPQS